MGAKNHQVCARQVPTHSMWLLYDGHPKRYPSECPLSRDASLIPHLGGGADDHAVVISDDAVQLLHGKLVLDVRMVPALLEYVHTDLQGYHAPHEQRESQGAKLKPSTQGSTMARHAVILHDETSAAHLPHDSINTGM